MLAFFFIAAGAGAVVSHTPNSLTPPSPERAGQVRELWPLLLPCEHCRVVLSGGEAPARDDARGRVGFVRATSNKRSKCDAVRFALDFALFSLFFPMR